MSMSEFIARFAAKDEKSLLFEALRRVGRLDRKVMLQDTVYGWVEWPPVDDPGSPGVRIAEA